MVSGAETSWKNNAVSGAESRTVEDRTEEPEACCDVCPGCALRACCGCDLHSIEINLYTASHSDDSEKYVRCIVAELPPSMAAECVQPLSFAVSSGNEILRKQPLPQDVVLSIRGLRAAPALA